MTYDLQVLFAEVDRRLSDNPTQDLAQLARDLGSSHPTIEKAIKTHSASSFRTFRNKKRIEKIALLEKQGMTAKEIAYELGYKWPENYSRFKHTKQ